MIFTTGLLGHLLCISLLGSNVPRVVQGSLVRCHVSSNVVMRLIIAPLGLAICHTPYLGFLVNSETRHTEGANNQISEKLGS